MNKVVLDTSAVLAYLFQEPGAEKVALILETGAGLISSVNYAELVGKLIDQGMSSDLIRETLYDLDLNIIDYDEYQAFLTGELRTVSKAFGLSLGDRACLTLGIIKKLPILTADRIWLKVPVQTQVQVIRE